jgi:anti-sigma regulatory factor (Ser/Thr protein kinase)
MSENKAHPEKRQAVYLMLRMKPPWVFIDEIRRFVESFCACACTGANRESQLALAVHELMQNAVPHSHDEEVDLVLEVDPDADRVAVAVTNRTTDAEFTAIRDRIARMNSEPDALRHYVRAMKESPVTVRGGLGLARIRFEAQLELSVTRSDTRVTVHATGPLHVPALKLSGGSYA